MHGSVRPRHRKNIIFILWPHAVLPSTCVFPISYNRSVISSLCLKQQMANLESVETSYKKGTGPKIWCSAVNCSKNK